MRTDLEISNTKNAGWAWRCWLCDENEFDLPNEAEAVEASQKHLKSRTHWIHSAGAR